MSHLLIQLPGLLLLTLSGSSFSSGRLLNADQPSWDQGSEMSLEPGQGWGTGRESF